MASQAKSRWADDEEDAVLEAQRKREKEFKKQAKAEKQRRLNEKQSLGEHNAATANTSLNGTTEVQEAPNRDHDHPAKRRRLSPDPERPANQPSPKLLRFPTREWGPCRHVENFEKLNHIEEGSYGWVSRAREVATGEVVALKKLKMDNLNDGFPVTGLREIQTLMASRHTNIVTLREVVMGDNLDE